MSKSHPDPKSRILITDTPSEIHLKIKRSLTDSQNSVSYEPSTRPGVSNLLEILSHFDDQGRSPEVLGEVYSSMGLGEFKGLVAERISEMMEPVGKRFERFIGDKAYLEEVRRKGAERARENAERTMVDVRKAVGL